MPKLHETFILTAKFVLKEENCSSDDNLTLCETILGLPWGNREKLQNELKDSQTFKEYFLKKYSDFRHYSVTQKEDFEGLFPIAQEFFIEVLVQLKDRIPYTNKILNSCSAIRLQDFKAEKWKILANQFSNIVLKNNMNSVQNELDILEFNFKDLGLKLASLSQNLIVFWSSQKSDYPLLSKLVLACITLSYSTVSIERTFSILRDIKTPKRNKLCFASVEACLLIHHESKDGFQVKQKMLENYKSIWKNTAGKEKEEQKSEVIEVKEQESEEKGEEKTKEINPDDYILSPTYKNKRLAQNPISKEENGSFLKNPKLPPQKD